MRVFFFFFNDTATTEIYTLSLHDALPILHGRAGAETRLKAPYAGAAGSAGIRACRSPSASAGPGRTSTGRARSRLEEHTAELPSRQYLVCRLLLEKKKKANVIGKCITKPL